MGNEQFICDHASKFRSLFVFCKMLDTLLLYTCSKFAVVSMYLMYVNGQAVNKM